MILTFNIIHNKNTLTFAGQEYVRDINNPYVYIAVNPITTIRSCAFYNCKSLTTIVISDSVTTISSCAFDNCTSLTEIVIPDSVTTISHCAFVYCTSLTTINIPDSVTTIGNNAIVYCRTLTTIETNNENAYIIEYCKTHYPNIEVIVTNESYVLK